jgi:hypothetical protein
MCIIQYKYYTKWKTYFVTMMIILHLQTKVNATWGNITTLELTKERPQKQKCVSWGIKINQMSSWEIMNSTEVSTLQFCCHLLVTKCSLLWKVCNGYCSWKYFFWLKWHSTNCSSTSTNLFGVHHNSVRKKYMTVSWGQQHSGMEKCYKILTTIIGIKVSGTKELFFSICFKLAAN